MSHKVHHQHNHYDPTAIPPERQATCPVTGDIVDTQDAEDKGHIREYKGKKYYFCCATCPQLFDKNPEKYVK
jgi:YHS domain-containing protein